MFKEKWPRKNDKGGNCLIPYAFLSAGLMFGCANLSHSAETGGGITSSPVSSFTLAPIRLAFDGGGQMVYQLRRTSNANTTQTSQEFAVSAYSGVKARSFIWQPWFSTVNAGASLGIGKGYSNSSQSSSNKSTTLSFNGNASITLIPLSRFPFEAAIRGGRTRQSSGVSSRDSNLQITVLSLSQKFLSRNGSVRGSLDFSRDITSDLIFSPNTNDLVSLNFLHIPLLLHSVQVNASVKRSLFPRYDSRTLDKKFTLNYNFRPTSEFSTNSILSLQNTNSKQGNFKSGIDSKQFSLFSNWASPSRLLNLIGSARVYSLGVVGGNSSFSGNVTDGSYFSLSGAYTISRETRANAQVAVNDDNVHGQIISTTASLNSSKSFSDSTNAMGFVYRKYIGANISSQNTTSSNTQISSNSLALNLSAGHSLTKQNRILSGTLTSNANQVLATGVSTNNEFTKPILLTTNGSTVWTANPGVNARSQTIAHISASDTRDFGSNNRIGPVQLYNFQLSRTEALPRHQTLTASINLQQVNQSASLTTPSRSSINTRAAINYMHNRPFGIRGMTLSSIFGTTHNAQQGALTESSDSWDNNVNYILGLLEFNLRVNFDRSFNQKRSMINFMAKRVF